MFNDDIFTSVPFSAGIAPQKFMHQRKTQSQLSAKLENTYSDTESDRLIKAIGDTNKKIDHYKLKIEEYDGARVLVKKLVRDLEISTDNIFYEQNSFNKGVSVEHIDDIKMLRKAILLIIQTHNNLAQKFTESFEKKAKEVTEDMSRIQKEIIEINMKNFDAKNEILILERQSEILHKEKESLVNLAQTKKQELNLKEKSVLSEIQEEMIKAGHILKKKRTNIKKKSIIKEKPLPKFIRMGPEEATKFFHKETAIIEEQTQKDNQELDNLRDELSHLKFENIRAKKFLNELKNSISLADLTEAENEALSIRKSIEVDRTATKDLILKQIRRNKELQRKLADLSAEEADYKGHLAQSERQLEIQLNSLPALSKKHKKIQSSKQSLPRNTFVDSLVPR